MTDKDKEIKELRQRIEVLEQENMQMRRQIGVFVGEFRVCRFCANLHADCSPNDATCFPQWRGL